MRKDMFERAETSRISTSGQQGVLRSTLKRISPASFVQVMFATGRLKEFQVRSERARWQSLSFTNTWHSRPAWVPANLLRSGIDLGMLRTGRVAHRQLRAIFVASLPCP